MHKIIRISIRTLFLSIALFTLSSFLSRDQQSYFSKGSISSPFVEKQSDWVDSLMDNLTLKQKIAQLCMYAVYSNKTEAYNKSIEALVEKYQIGGLIFMQGGPHRQVQLNNRLQELSNIPLMIGFDGEWGLTMRLDSVQPYPKAMALGAIQNEQLVFDFGEELGRQCRRLGIHVNFAPVIDINSNPDNPIINTRSFGEDKFNVARKGLAVTMGMQSQNVLAVGKHFPGHGDTHSDSHYTLPVISHNKGRLDTLEFYPFKTLINNGIGGIMVAHIAMTSLGESKDLPASLSNQVITKTLKEELGFEGLIFTDALNMKGVTRDFKAGEIELRALQAGNDILLFPVDIELALEKIVTAVEVGELSEETINERCRKVLRAKEWMGLSNYKAISKNDLITDLSTANALYLEEKLVEASTTVVDRKGLLPIKDIANKRIASVFIGNRKVMFDSTLNLYKKVESYVISKSATLDEINNLKDSLKGYDYVIISEYQSSGSPSKNYGISANEVSIVTALLEHPGSILALFANPYSLRRFNDFPDEFSLILSYENKLVNHRVIAQTIFGARVFNGKVPVTCGNVLNKGEGDVFQNPFRLAYTDASAFGLPTNAFQKIDSLATYAIESGATPGCQILYAKKGKVVYSKTFGSHTYQNQRAVQVDDLYDIASVTKVFASTLALMKMYELKLIEPSDKISKHLRYLKKTDKKNVRINEIISHQSGFHSWIPFYRATLDPEGNLEQRLYQNEVSDSFNMKVMEDLYLRSDYRDTIFQAILDTPLYKKKKYRYSDLGYYWMPDLVQKKTDQIIEDFINDQFFESLGMEHTLYNPLNQFPYLKIVPSEHDQDFRKSVVRGYVNDQGAAMLNGVSGHAGLFSTTNDMAILSQMLLNNGIYGGKRYLDEKTIQVFNKSYYKRKGNRRALGFDKPALKKGAPGPCCDAASALSFGHSGFTGAYFWVDPEDQSIFVFLANRTFPDQNNRKLANEDIRTDMHQLFYDAFE